jgi:hypothetical protein
MGEFGGHDTELVKFCVGGFLSNKRAYGIDRGEERRSVGRDGFFKK